MSNELNIKNLHRFYAGNYKHGSSNIRSLGRTIVNHSCKASISQHAS